MIILIGCGKNTASAYKDFSSGVAPNILACGSPSATGDSYFYVIDINTGVVYLSYSAGYHHGITVMLNADGTPITAEQLGIDYKGEKK